MNIKLICNSIGKLCYLSAACLLLSTLVELHYPPRDFPYWFLLPAALALALGILLCRVRPNEQNLYARDGIAAVVFGWLVITLLGALPFLLSRVCDSFIDSFFESISGFSTTGASILRDVESLTKGLLFWRSFSQWLGGLGFLALMSAFSSSVKAQTIYVLQSEITGPTLEKFVPKIENTIKILYAIYVILTLGSVLALTFCRMPLFDAVLNSFGAVATGGFSINNAGIAEYNSLTVEIVLTVIMLASGVNFTLYYMFVTHSKRAVVKDEELHFYLGTFAVLTIAIAICLHMQGVFESFGESLRRSAFHVSSIITTAGYTSYDYNLWPLFPKALLLLLMFFGGSAGSTSGGIKHVRILLLFKLVRREVGRLTHPRSAHVVTLNGKAVDNKVLHAVGVYFFLLISLFFGAFILISFDTNDFTTAFSAVAACINSIGPGFNAVGPSGNYADFSSLSKVVFIACMFIGRLEIYPIVVLFTPSFWRRSGLR
ncbi:MAG: TrkH family potassium uptake protein [Oscillospiraceae bacterium]|jgi:trk system potassium uptake protein TrkH|nr:TrkH family potassium uptake protein [Oscillospiraceae bacterium]